ncbi:hypothetical protein KFU94_66315 [Chloroflexi bacterium TSY]|nr:hypothetical protein [Chloroflexi bacterium TSY]
MISKPSYLHVPPWQLVSALLDGISLRVASWWAHPKLYSTTASIKIECWKDGLPKPGPVQIATSGQWGEKTIHFEGKAAPTGNHAKIGVSLDTDQPYSIFGDLNQQGALCTGYAYHRQECSSSQNGRGGTFYILDAPRLFQSVTEFLNGESAPVHPTHE